MVTDVPNDNRLVLSGEVMLREADAIHARLLDMAVHPVVEIDCSGVTQAGLNLVQLILAARLSAQRAGRSVVLTQPIGDVMRQLLQRGGFIGPDGGQPLPDQAFWLPTASV